ncbi:MAG: hypothetical protein AAF085_16035, partial [Planctomycetota bacterium]
MSGWSVFCVVLGCAMVLTGLVLLLTDLMKYRKATGKVVGNKSYTNETVERFAPKIRFKTEAGETRTFQSICYFSSSPYEEGEPIPV